MINQIIAFSIKNKLFIGLMTLALIVGGIYSMTQVPLDAVPDVTNNQVQIITQAPNLGTEDIEQFISYPIELAMANLPGLLEIRSISRFGLSVVTIVFEDNMGTYLPRQLINEKIEEVKKDIPSGFGDISMGPISTGLGEIYQYSLTVDPNYHDVYTSTDLRTIQDWIVKRQMAMVSGVIEVNSFGGNIKQYEVAYDPDHLNAMGLNSADILAALELNNQNTGGAYIEKNHMASFIRGEGLARSQADLENIVVKNVNNLPIKIKDVANVQIGSAIRYGAFTKDGQGEAVGGIIFMLKGSNSNKVISNVKERIEQIQGSLPEGVYIEPFLDRSQLISKTTRTIKTNLIEGALIVIFILVFFLGNWRGGLIVASTIPLSLLFAFILMHYFDVWANLMSLGAIDFGIIVDGAVIIVEGTVFLLYQKSSKGSAISAEERDELTYKASSKMMNAAFFGQLIILLVFVPILFLEGIEGKMFKPMALTFMFAMIGAMILCLTYVPMVSALFIRPSKKDALSWGDKTVIWIEEKYEKALNGALKKAALVLGAAVALLVLALYTFTRMGGEFIPQLDEGDIAFHIIMTPGSTLTEGIKTSTEIEKILLANFPEIEHVLSRFGVAEVPTDPMPMDMADCFIILKPKSEWVTAETKEELINQIKDRLAVIPGINLEFSQPIEMRFNELISGVREDIAVKLYGEDLDVLADKAAEIGRLIRNIEGVADMKVEATSGLPQMTVSYQRERLAQYGLNISDINQVIETAFAGVRAGVIFEGERRFDLVVRMDEDSRKSIEDVRNLYIITTTGARVPLHQVAEINYETGPMQIGRDDTQRRTYVGINVRGRDIKTLVEEIQAKLNAELDLPSGYFLRYGGAFENLERATQKLKIVVPIALAMIFFLIYLALGSFTQTAMIYIAIPLAAIGGVYSLWLRDMSFSISAGVGFIVLFGVAVLNGLVLISSWNDLKKEGVTDLSERIKLGSKRRIRPILLTALTDIFGFLPMALSGSAGAEVQQPLATVVIGGMITSTLLTLFVLPILYRWTETRSSKFTLPRSTGFVVILGLCTLGVGTTQAQDGNMIRPISMEEAVNRAISNYPLLKSSRLSIEQEEVLKKTAWDLGSTNIFTSGDEVGAEGQGVITPIGILQQNIDVFGIAPKLEVQRRRKALAEANYHLDELELTQKVKVAYANAFVAAQRVSLYHALDTVYREFERAAKIRFEVEETSKLAYLAASTQVKQIALQKAQMEYDLADALIGLNLWLVSDTLFTTVISDENSLTAPLREGHSLEAHPLLELASENQRLADSERRSISADYYPKLQAQYGSQQVDRQRGFYQYQFGITVPLFFLPQKGRIQAARLQSRIAEQNYQQTYLELNAGYQSLLQQYQKWLSSWTFFKEEALPLAREQREGALLAFKEGEIEYVTLIQNLNESIQVEIRAQEALNLYLQTKYQLEYYLQSK
ncbi:MAG TPA: CusA/CzcA family heavy metal efflux RND transporter [Anditalea sp.]|nr:CusA/CzcA family heavy metal efflux RND transporter [Anditalea sp.]